MQMLNSSFVLGFGYIVFLIYISFCIMRSAYNLLLFLILCSHHVSLCKGCMLSRERAPKIANIIIIIRSKPLSLIYMHI